MIRLSNRPNVTLDNYRGRKTATQQQPQQAPPLIDPSGWETRGEGSVLFPPSKSRMENTQKLTQLSPRSHSSHLVGKRTAQKDVIDDITSGSQVNSYFQYKWSPASLTINNYFYLFVYLYITRITINNGTPHLKSLKSQNRRAA